MMCQGLLLKVRGTSNPFGAMFFHFVTVGGMSVALSERLLIAICRAR